jgi:hypothetical protein
LDPDIGPSDRPIALLLQGLKALKLECPIPIGP